MTRRVKIFEHGSTMLGEETTMLEQEGIFHEFGLEVDQDSESSSSYTVAIVETADGKVYPFPLCLIQFLDKTQ